MDQGVRWIITKIQPFVLDTVQVGDDRQITGIKVWNTANKPKRKTWEAELTIRDLRTIAIKFVEVIEENQRPN